MDIFRFKTRNVRFHKCCDKFTTIAYPSLSNICYAYTSLSNIYDCLISAESQIRNKRLPPIRPALLGIHIEISASPNERLTSECGAY